MTVKERLEQYIKEDKIYQDFIDSKTKIKDLTDFGLFCIQHCTDIGEILEENKQLKEENRELRADYGSQAQIERDLLLIENKELKEKFKATNKGLQKVRLKRKKWKHRYELAKHEIKELKSQLKGTTHCFDEEEHERLKKQIEEYKATNEILSQELTKDKVLQQDHLTTCCGIPIGDIPKLKEQLEETNRKLFFTKNELNMRQKSIDNKLNQQKEFIKWLEDYLKLFDNMDIEEQASYDTIEEILQKYKEIVNGTERD